VAQNVQQSVSTYRKLHWANTDKAKCNELVGQLKKYIDGLFDVLPPNATIIRISQPTSLHLSFNIPFNLPDIRRNADFIGREDLLEQLKREIEKGAATMDIIQIVLHGMGGMGKTQLAMEYIYRHFKNYSSVFWINAASEQTTKISFTHIMQQLIKHHAKLSEKPDYPHIGRLLGMAGKLDSMGMFTVQQPSEEQHIVNAVKEWLTAEDNTKWLLVFDNFDDLESFDINDYIPTSAHGTVIITSRRRQSIQGRRVLEVMQMDNSEAEELLFRSAKLDLGELSPGDYEREKEAAAAIVQKLGYLPLAIDQAGAYIHTRDYLFSRYLKEYQANVTQLLSKKWKVGKNDRSVFAAWDLSFNAIQNQNPKAAELLLLFGFLNNNDICEELLKRGMKLPKDDTSLEDSIQILFSYSMAKRKNRGDHSLNIHPVVHMWAQWKLEMEPESYNKKAIEAFYIVASAIVTGGRRKVEDWVFERQILPHIFAVERQIKILTMENKEILEAVNNLRNVYMEHGYFRKAEELSRVILAGYEKLLGTEHADTLTAVHDMAVVFQRQGQYKEALELFERALVGRETLLGTDHLHTLSVVHDMGVVFHQQGQYHKALEFYERVLVGREKSLGTDHLHTLTTVYSVGIVFHQQRQYQKALEFYERVLVGREKSLGADHPSTLHVVSNMAGLFYHQKQYDKALELLEQALAGEEKALGTDHPDTLAVVHVMGMVFYQQGQYHKAIEFYERALVGRERTLGADHPETLATVHHMAAVFYSQEHYNKALELYERVLVGREKSLGVDHPETLGTVNNMAEVFFCQGQYNKALEWCERALVGREKLLGTDHPGTLTTVHNMGMIFHEQGQYHKALEFFERALGGTEKSLGVDHPDTLGIIRDMADSFEAIGQSHKAQELRERASGEGSTNKIPTTR
ncbi:P-loop containing nucleoside triphosphate hydrolase protein, partial [Kalaharituber pfeilii]